MSVDRYKKLMKVVADRQRELERAVGAYQQIMRDVKRKYGCRSIEDAQALLKKMREECSVAEKKLEKKLDEFERKWGDRL